MVIDKLSLALCRGLVLALAGTIVAPDVLSAQQSAPVHQDGAPLIVTGRKRIGLVLEGGGRLALPTLASSNGWSSITSRSMTSPEQVWVVLSAVCTPQG